MLATQNPTQTKAWAALEAHFAKVKDVTLQQLFAQDAARAPKYTLQWEDFLVDYSKNNWDETTRNLLLQLAEECDLKASIEKYFTGDKINATEGRAVLHTALRSAEKQILVDGQNVIPEVEEVKAKIKAFSQEIISGKRKGYTGKPFTDVVNIGIGGSDLGPVMVSEALKFYKNHLNINFISNVDGDHVHEVIKHLNPETTLFVIVSKTFTTQETLSNALTVKKWFLKHAKEADVAQARCKNRSRCFVRAQNRYAQTRGSAGSDDHPPSGTHPVGRGASGASVGNGGRTRRKPTGRTRARNAIPANRSRSSPSARRETQAGNACGQTSPQHPKHGRFACRPAPFRRPPAPVRHSQNRAPDGGQHLPVDRRYAAWRIVPRRNRHPAGQYARRHPPQPAAGAQNQLGESRPRVQPASFGSANPRRIACTEA